MSRRFPGQKIGIRFLIQFGQARAQPGHALKGPDPFRQLSAAAKPRTPAELFQPLVRIDPYEAVQRERAGFSVRQMELFAQRIAAGMAGCRLGDRKGQSAQQRSLRQRGPGFPPFRQARSR